MTQPAITAKITARGSECTTIDRGDGIEADICADGAYLCSVTLLPHEDGRPGWSAWGSADHWCSEPAEARGLLGERWAGILVSAVEAADHA